MSRCISAELNQYRELAKLKSNSNLIVMMKNTKAFHQPMRENNRLWRLYCGVMRREAHKRGLEVPPMPT